jgi:hypothetical protein
MMRTYLTLPAFLFAQIITYAQDLPETKLVPVTTTQQTGFLKDTISRLWNVVPVKKHHKAGVKISCPNGNAGSGSIIRTVDDKLFVVVTNHHVIEGNENSFVNIIATGGLRTNAKVVWWDSNADVAVLINTTRGVPNGFPIYNGSVKSGDTVEVVAFGGPGRMVPEEDLRPFTGRVVNTQYPAAICVDAYTVSGDSGSAILYEGAICGVNWGHYGYPTVSVEGWSAGKPMASHVDGPWLARTLTQICQPYGCRPVIRGPQEIIIHPPTDSEQSLEAPIEVTPPENDYSLSDEDINKIVDTVASHPKLQPIQGPPGPPGEQGPKGDVGPPGEPTLISQEQIDAIVEQVISRIPACNCPQSPIPDGDSTPPEGPQANLESNRVLYFTADSCVSCHETTNMVNSLKRAGYPITIITLTTSMAEAHQVPQVFVPTTKERALGPTKVKEFLSTLSL